MYCQILDNQQPVFIETDTSLGFRDQEGIYEHKDLITKVETIAQTWSNLLELSGGSLNFKK